MHDPSVRNSLSLSFFRSDDHITRHCQGQVGQLKPPRGARCRALHRDHMIARRIRICPANTWEVYSVQEKNINLLVYVITSQTILILAKFIEEIFNLAVYLVIRNM